MRRSRLRVALLAVVAAALGGIGLATWQNMHARRPRTPLDLGADFLPDVAQHIRNFRRVKVKDGKAVWEVKADDAQYFDGGQILVRKPQVIFHLDGVESYQGREVYRVTFEPTGSWEGGGTPWKGEALIDTEQLQPLLVTTQLAHGIPVWVRVVFGTNVHNVGFKVTYQEVDDGVWFPA